MCDHTCQNWAIAFGYLRCETLLSVGLVPARRRGAACRRRHRSTTYPTARASIKRSHFLLHN